MQDEKKQRLIQDLPRLLSAALLPFMSAYLVLAASAEPISSQLLSARYHRLDQSLSCRAAVTLLISLFP